MGLFSNPLGYAGYPPNPATATTVNSTVRAATAIEAAAGKLNDVYISPATQASAVALDFANPPALGFGSSTPRPVHATTLTSTGNSTIGSGASSVVQVGGSTSTLGFFGTTPHAQETLGAITNNVTVGGTTGTLANFTSLSVYATDATAIQNDIYQLGLAVSGIITALKAYGISA